MKPTRPPPEDGSDSDVRNAHAERPPQGTANTDSDDYNSDSDDAEDSSSESSDEGDDDEYGWELSKALT